jgi:mannose-6-phosphate isomerase-like protein (cupin superfamily)
LSSFLTKRLPMKHDAIAPDGSDVRVLLGLKGGGLAHFELASDQTSVAVAHHSVEEIWFFLNGRGEMWRELEGFEEIVSVEAGVCITIPVGTKFQFRSFCYGPLAAIGVTMPPWPEDGDAYPVKGKWEASVKPGTG